MASRSWSRVAQRRMLRTFFCRSARKNSIAALSELEATRPIEPARAWRCSRLILPREGVHIGARAELLPIQVTIARQAANATVRTTVETLLARFSVAPRHTVALAWMTSHANHHPVAQEGRSDTHMTAIHATQIFHGASRTFTACS